MRRNYHRKLSASIFHHAKNVGIIGILAYPKNKVVIWSKDLKIIKYHATQSLHGAKEGGREGYRERVREIKGNREGDGEWEKEKYTQFMRKHQRTIH